MENELLYDYLIAYNITAIDIAIVQVDELFN
jgi:hypothetical protein